MVITCLAFIDEPMGVNNLASHVLLRYYYDLCNRLKMELEKYEQQEAERPEEG